MASLPKLAGAVDRLVEIAPAELGAAFQAAHDDGRRRWEAGARPRRRSRCDLRGALEAKVDVLLQMIDFACQVAAAVHSNGLTAANAASTDPEAMALSLDIVANALIVFEDPPEPRRRLQGAAAAQCSLWSRLLAIERKVELRKYASGYRSAVVRVLANTTYKNSEACEAVWEAGLLPVLLQHTHLDEENPCLREWASFAIANLMALPQAQEFLRGLRLEGISVEQTPGFDLEQLGLDCHVETDPDTGVQTIRTRKPPWARD